MKKNSKGFTLIELLAVILILGVIALIAIPVITSIISDSKMGASKISAQNLVKAIETDCQKESLSKAIQKTYVFTNGESNIEISLKGDLPSYGTINVNDSCDTEVLVIYDGYIFTKDYNETELTLTEKIAYKDGTIVYFNPIEGKVCNNYIEENSNHGNVSGCMKWYIYNDSEENTSLTALLDHNISGILNWISLDDYIAANDNVTVTAVDNKYGPITLLNALESITTNANWVDGLNERLITAQEIANIIGADAFKTGSYDIYHFDPVGEVTLETCTKDNIGNCKFGWLYDRTSPTCTTKGCANNDNNGETWGYWTSTGHTASTGRSWYIAGNGSLGYRNKTLQSGVRPVIEIQKSLLRS